MVVFKLRLNNFIIFLKTVLEKFKCVENIMLLVILVKNFYELYFVGFRDRFIQDLEMCPCLWVKFLVYFEFNVMFFKWKVQINLFIEK